MFRFFVILICIIACSAWMWDNSARRTIQHIQGHWHSKTRGMITLDFIDTLVIVNRYSLLERPDTFSIIDRERGRLVLPIFCGCGSGYYPRMGRFSVHGDELVYDSILEFNCHPFEDMRFERGDPDQCKMDHATSTDSHIYFKSFPAAADESILSTVSSLSPYGDPDIQVGYASPDHGPGLKIQVNDVFISPEGLPWYFELQKEAFPIKRITYLWAIDESVPVDSLATILKFVPRDSATHFQLVRSKDGKRLGYKKMSFPSVEQKIDSFHSNRRN